MGHHTRYLIVAAHPDDEVLGAGGLMHRASREGEGASVCIMSPKAAARSRRPDDAVLEGNIESCARLLGARRVIHGGFPNMGMNTVPHLELVQFIERAILDEEPDVVVTHHSADLNNDHVQTALACQAAVRLFQRREGARPVGELWLMEVPSSTDWALDSARRGFSPNVFVGIGREGLEKKIEALSLYEGVMRDYPHPRSREAMSGLAAMRGGQAGLEYAEAFECVFRRVAP